MAEQPNPDQHDEMQRRFAEEDKLIKEKLSGVKHKIVVLSGKGGVGKSTVAANLAAALSKLGYKVGVLDVDVHGPSIPKILGADTSRATGDQRGISPVTTAGGLKLMSMEFFLGDKKDAVIWRGPLKMNLIRQFIKDVDWGELDFLIADSPPGTGDEPLSVSQTLGEGTYAVVVTTPQEVAIKAVRRSITFARQVGLEVIGLVENMSGYICPHCNKLSEPFGSMGGQALAEEMGVKLLGSIPLSQEVVPAGDAGTPPALDDASEIGAVYREVADEIIKNLK